jgi:hypothetical protein
MTMLRLCSRFLGALILLCACAQTAEAQWPTVIMFHGGALKQPVFAAGADTLPFSTFVGAPAPKQATTAKDMGDRAFVNVAFFWGPRDEPAQNGVRTLSGLKPEMSWHHGRFYPAAGDRPAMMFMTSLVQVKGRDSFGLMKVRSSGASTNHSVAVPTDPAIFTVGGGVPVPAIAVLKRLGVAQ